MTAPPEVARGSRLGGAGLVVLLALVLGGVLGAADALFAPRIEEQRRARLRRVALDVVPGGGALEEVTVGGAVVLRITAGPQPGEGALVGWAVPGEAPGFADVVRILVGLDPEARTITGLAVLDARETPGLGDRIREAEFCDRFAEHPIAGPIEIDAISGATVSSEAVQSAVEADVARVAAAIRRLEPGSASGEAPR